MSHEPLSIIILSVRQDAKVAQGLKHGLQKRGASVRLDHEVLKPGEDWVDSLRLDFVQRRQLSYSGIPQVTVCKPKWQMGLQGGASAPDDRGIAPSHRADHHGGADVLPSIVPRAPTDPHR